MKSVVLKAPLGSEFDDFLFAPLGEDRNGLTLSVVSLFGRMNLDPWQEAGTLAALSRQAAARRLAELLATLTDPALRASRSEATVLRLLALLPSRLTASSQTPMAGGGAVAAPDPGTRIRTILFIAAAILLVGSQLLSANRYPHGTAGAVPGPAAAPVASQALPAPTGH